MFADTVRTSGTAGGRPSSTGSAPQNGPARAWPQYAAQMVDDARADAPQGVRGRSEELERIDEMIERLATGRGSVVVLIGPPGAGLTTLLREAITRAGEAVADLRAVHVPGGLLEGDAATAMVAMASGGAGEAARHATEAAGLLDGLSTEMALDDPRLVRGAVDGLRLLSAERPLLVTVDNLPIDEASLFSALTSLAAGVATMPVMLVATSHVLPRSSYEDSPVGPLWVRRVPPLSTADAVALVRDVASRRAAHHVAAELGDRTGGSPGDLVAVCAALTPDQLAGAEPLPVLLPGTPVSAAIYRRWWESLDPSGRTLLLCAAEGRAADPRTLESCAGTTIAHVVGPDGEHALRVQADGVTSPDPRLLSAVHALAPPHEISAALSALAAAHPEESPERLWLEVRSGRPPTTEGLDLLAAFADAQLDRGEAASVEGLVIDVEQRLGPAPPPVDLLLLGGVAALHCGHTGRAVALLTRALREAPASLATIFPPLLIAMTQHDGAVPHRLVGSCLARLAREQPAAAVSVAAAAARLCATQGDEESGWRYLELAEAQEPEDAGSSPDLAGVALARAMLEHRSPGAGPSDALESLATRRPGRDVVGWQLEFQGLRQLIEGRRWPRAHAALADLRTRVRMCPSSWLRAELAALAMNLFLSTGEYRRADETATSAVGDRLPLDVALCGTAVGQLAVVALLRGRDDEAEGWLADLSEIGERRQRTGSVSSSLHEAHGLRATLRGDQAEAAEHLAPAVRAGGVLPSTVLDMAHLAWRRASGENPELARPWSLAEGTDGSRHDGDTALAIARTLLSAPAERVVQAVDSAARTAPGLVPPALEAQVLEVAADRVGALTAEQYAVQARAASTNLPPERTACQLLLLRRARRLYDSCGAAGRSAATDRAISQLERTPASDVAGLGSLTAEELTIARLVHRGATNREIAGELYLSVRTVELRLTSVYRKLGIRSRRELRQMHGVVEQDA
jgi:DNA-binding CsgD family transcriptional regulator